MKKIVLIFACGLGFCDCYSQITISQSDLPVAGETWIQYNDASSSVNLTPASASPQTWDYSTAFSPTSTTTYNYLTPSQVLGNSYFPNADIGVNMIYFTTDSFGTFYEKSNDGLYIQGYYNVSGGNSMSIGYDSNNLVIPVPFTYGSSRSIITKDVRFSYGPFPDAKTVSTITSYAICDAFGTLKTPVNPVTPADVIRIKFRRLSVTDSIFYDTAGTGNFYLDTVITYGPSIGISYQFFKQKNNCISKVMTIEYDSAGQYVDMARYYECSFSSGIFANTNINSSSIRIFPNPATGTIRLTMNTKHNAPVECEIVNVMGEKVFSKQLETVRMDSFGGNRKLSEWTLSEETKIDVSFLAKGIYLVRVGDGKSFENKKLVIVQRTPYGE